MIVNGKDDGNKMNKNKNKEKKKKKRKERFKERTRIGRRIEISACR